MPAPPYPKVVRDPAVTGVAWGVTALISALPDIALARLAGGVPTWLPFAKMGLALGLGGVALTWGPLRPLRGFALVMFALFGLSLLRTRLDFSSPPLQALTGGNAFAVRMQAEQTGKLAVSLAMIATLLVMGYRRRDGFLTAGDLRTPIEPVPLLGFPKADPWPHFALQWGTYIAAALAVVLYLGLRPGIDAVLRAVPLLPSVVLYAALNAFNEEVTYRAPMLATLEPACGSRQALWLSAYFFGIAHYFGTPGGLGGGVASIFMGWLLGKAMVETRGLFWAWWMHFLSDVAIFASLALALVQ